MAIYIKFSSVFVLTILYDRDIKLSVKKRELRKNGISKERGEKWEEAKGGERNGEGDHRSLLIHPDYKVRLRLSDMAKSCLSSSSFSPSLSPLSLSLFKGEQGLLLVMRLCLKLCVAIVKSEDLFIFYTQLLTAK